MKLLNEGEDLIQYNGTGTQARLVFQIYEGPRIRIHAISVQGEVKTKTRVILREANFKLGEVLTPQKIDDATARLNRMNLFSRVDIRTLEEGTTVGERTVVISVTERDPGLFTFGGGVTNERNLTLRGFTAASYNNIAGTARAVSGRAEIRSNVGGINYPENEVTVGYMEPFLLGTRTRGRINLTRSDYVFNYEPKDTQTEINIKNKIDLLLERDLTQHTKLTYKLWSLESRKDFERYGRCLVDTSKTNAPDFDPNSHCGSNTLQVASIGPQFDIDYRDNPFLPTRGSFTRFNVDYSHPSFGSSRGVQFWKADGGYTYYQRLGSPKWVWANSVHGGYQRNLSSSADSGIPTDWSFLLGGIYTVRGFDLSSPNNRIPKDGSGATPEHPDGFVLGEANEKLIHIWSDYYLLKSELRVPLYEEWGGVIFYDGGAVHIRSYDFNRAYRDAVGFGVRYNTPVGPLAIDIAFKIRPEQGEDPFKVHFSIGTF
jgi:outer membrane protein assembly factor BamA